MRKEIMVLLVSLALGSGAAWAQSGGGGGTGGGTGGGAGTGAGGGATGSAGGLPSTGKPGGTDATQKGTAATAPTAAECARGYVAQSRWSREEFERACGR
jgi:hypothetical protein